MYSLDTAENVYMAVLDGIKKESTAVLLPEQFNRLINVDAMTEWLNQTAPISDFDQSVVDALSNLVKVKIIAPTVTLEGQYHIKLPKNYYRLQSVSFKLDISGKQTDWLPVKRVRSDSYSLAVSGVNPYRKASNERLYYMQVDDTVKSFPTNDKVVSAKIIYLSRPAPIVYNEDPDGNHSHGNLNKEQKKEVVDIAVRIFLERVKEERYQTQLMEKNLK
jgi:hypothetical protein